ncbi:MAG: TIGR03663 family protein [Anaerolineae bacterium]|nr:TIGR03663 family protein [Anaerolineae bacterium]
MTDLTTPTTVTSFLTRPLRFSLDWEKSAYLLILILALFTRLWGLDQRVVSHDESLHTQFAYQYFRGEGYQHNPMMHGPMVFHSAATFYWLFGVSDGSARIPAALVGVILVMLPILLRPWIGQVGALFTSFLLLISPFMTYYSRYIREDIFIITWAAIIFIAIWSYLRQRQDKYLYWFAAANALMFATKENSYIYIAIFGGFLVLRLGLTLWQTPWFHKALGNQSNAILLIAVGLIIFGGGFVAQRQAEQAAATTATPASDTTGFAADPNAPTPITPPTLPGSSQSWGWIQLGGIVAACAGLFMGVNALRPRLQEYAEFDLIVLFTAFTLPTIAPLLAVMTGWTPRDYNIPACSFPETLSPVTQFLGRWFSLDCWQAYFGSGGGHINLILIGLLTVSIALGLWWDKRRWLIVGGIFHLIFIALFTALFSFPRGWHSGIVDSLAYWMEQHEVQRGNQPNFYYLFVLPFYEFLSVIFALLATRLWARKNRLNKILGYWLTVILVALLSYSLINWYTNLNLDATAEPERLTGILVGGLILIAGGVYWMFVYAGQLQSEYKIKRNWSSLFSAEVLGDFVPFLVWWVIMSFVLYTFAGEKMPWLSTHFILPLVLLSGWYLNEQAAAFDRSTLLSRRWWYLLGLMLTLVLAVLFTLYPILVGRLAISNPIETNLIGLVMLVGGALLVMTVYLLYVQVEKGERSLRPQSLIFAIFILLSLLTIRFNQMANGPNADATNEFIVYAHGNASTKNIVLNQVEQLSQQMYGDKSIKVAFDDDVAWPYTWYLRDYPNRFYFGATPSNTLLDSPVILIGSRNWGKIDATLQEALDQNYRSYTLTFLWWPIEDYRSFGWSSFLGIYPTPTTPIQTEPRKGGIFRADVRQALWGIFFNRDYRKYGEVFGGTYTAGQWPLRRELRLYIRNEAVTGLWQEGDALVRTLPDIAPVPPPPLEDIYKDDPLEVTVDRIINNVANGGFSLPRNMAIGPDGNLYVADSNNHRIVVLDENGNFLRQWGQQGTEEGQLNEPWAIAVDNEAVYVADTWNHRLQKFTLTGQFIATIGQPGDQNSQPLEGLGLFFGPRSILLWDDGLMLVTDTGNHRIQLLDRNGVTLQAIGGRGTFVGLFSEPVGLARTPDGLLLVADTWNGRIQIFTPDLRPFIQWPIQTWAGESTNNKPYLAADSQGRIYVTDPEQGRILVFGPAGDYIGFFNSLDPDGELLALPTGITIDSEDRIYVVDTASNRIIRYQPLVIFVEPTPTPTPEETPTPEATATEEPTPTPTATMTATPTVTPTATAIPEEEEATPNNTIPAATATP